jgi:hypothetical protein
LPARIANRVCEPAASLALRKEKPVTDSRVRSAIWRIALALPWCAVGLAAAGEPPVPSGPHPRLFMSRDDVAGYAASARAPTSAASKLIERCQRTIDHPDEYATRGGVDGDYWPGASVACAFAYRVTGQKSYLTQAMTYWRASLNDDQKLADGLGCTAEHAAPDWRPSWNGEPPVPPALVTVTHDTWYPIRWYGPYVALTYDWLYAEADEPLRAQTRRCLAGWVDGYTRFGYLRDSPGANYHAGFVIAKTLAAVAIGNDGGADSHLWTETLRDLFAKQLVGKGLSRTTGGLGQRAGLLVGGDWGTWQYGPLSVLEYAVATRVVTSYGAPQPELEAWLKSVMLRAVHGIVPRMDRQFSGNGDYEGEGEYAVYPGVQANQLDAVLAGPSTDQVAAWAQYVRQRRNLRGDNVWNALAELRKVSPQDYRAQTPTPPLWYLARGVGNLYVRTSWREDALWAVFLSGTPTADHAHYAASSFVLSRGGDHLIVDSANYTQFSTLGSNGIAVDTSAPGGYARTQGPWGVPTMPWVRATSDGVFAARSDFARAFAYNGTPSEIKYAQRDWVMLPEGEIVAIDRVRTDNASRSMYLSFHANTGGALALDPTGGIAVGKVGDSQLAIHRVRLSGGTPAIVKTRKSDCPGDCRYPCGSCTAARFDVDVYTVAVPGPFAVAIHVFDALGTSEPLATVGSINDEPFDPSPQRNRAVIGASVLRGARQSYVIASAATDGARPATMTYGVAGASLGRHIVFDAPEASDGTSAITAASSGGRCVVTLAPGRGGGATGHPLIFDVASAASGCTVKPATDVPGAAPLALNATADPSDSPDDDFAEPAPAPRGSLRWWYRHLRRPLFAIAVVLPIPALVVVARRRRRASQR